MGIKFARFDDHPSLRYGFSSKSDGSMHRHLCKENRTKYFKSINIDPQRVVIPDLVHGAKAVRVREDAAGTMVTDVDALATDAKNLVLSMTSADCFPVYLYDPARPAIGIAHVGWRGLLRGIVSNVVELMENEFGTKPDDLLVGIGPGIRNCHFSIKPGDIKLYAEYPAHVSEKDGSVLVDIPGIIKEQLKKCGIKAGNIEDSGLCTFCESEEYFSYRRDKPARTEVMVAHIGLK